MMPLWTMPVPELRGLPVRYSVVTGIGTNGVTAALNALHEQQDTLRIHARLNGHTLAALPWALSKAIEAPARVAARPLA